MTTQGQKSRRTEMQDMTHYPYTKLATESSDDETYARDGGFTIHIYESELEKIKKWVLDYKNIETGGDLFGLWVDDRTAVVQFALGPGEKCRRTNTSFFQDVDYLATAGGYLIEKHGLCNIGQWHSHHQLSLNQPSAGDKNTVWGNMPGLRMKRYIVCIANILKQGSPYKTSLKSFLFEMNDNGEKMPIMRGKFKDLRGESPVNNQPEVAEVIARGAEPEVARPDFDKDDSKAFSLAQCWSSLKKFLCSRKGKILTILTSISIAVIIVLVVYRRDIGPSKDVASQGKDYIPLKTTQTNNLSAYNISTGG